MRYKIQRPPLHPNFELPSREELLNLKLGDNVKLIFEVDGKGERMWVILKEISNPEEWVGFLNNDPIQKEIQDVLKADDEVRFHPLDIISIYLK